MTILSDYEKRALQEIKVHKDQMSSANAYRLVPAPVREQISDQGKKYLGRLRAVPGFDKASVVVRKGYLDAIGGVGKALNQGSRLTLSEFRVVSAYKRRGFDVSKLSDIHNLDLRAVEKETRPAYLTFLYSGAAAFEGAGSGLLITGGEILAGGGEVAGAGAGAAPGIGVITGAVAVDAAAVLAICSRVVGHTAMYYGYDPREPGEAVFALGVINLGSAVSRAGKYSAFSDLSRLTQLLARNASWDALNKSIVPRVMSRFAQAFGIRLTKRKLGQLIPLIGIGVGAGFNYHAVDQVADAAYWTYRERFLNGKQGIDVLRMPAPPAVDSDDNDVPIDLFGIIEQAQEAEIAERDGQPPNQGAHDDDDPVQ